MSLASRAPHLLRQLYLAMYVTGRQWILPLANANDAAIRTKIFTYKG